MIGHYPRSQRWGLCAAVLASLLAAIGVVRVVHKMRVVHKIDVRSSGLESELRDTVSECRGSQLLVAVGVFHKIFQRSLGLASEHSDAVFECHDFADVFSTKDEYTQYLFFGQRQVRRKRPLLLRKRF